MGCDPCRMRKGSWWLRVRVDRDVFRTQHSTLASTCARQLLQFCFTGILSKEIIDISEGWNYHRVRSTKGSICPAGIPKVLFFVPELYDGHDYKSAVDDDLINFTDNTLGASLREYGCTDEFAELCLEIMDIKNRDIPQSVDDALDLYCNLFLIFQYPDTM